MVDPPPSSSKDGGDGCCVLCGRTDHVQSRSLDNSLRLCASCLASASAMEEATLRRPQPYRPPSCIFVTGPSKSKECRPDKSQFSSQRRTLYVGCEHSTRDARRLRHELGVAHVIAAARPQDTHLPVNNPEGIRLTILNVDDDPLENISQHFDRVYEIYQSLGEDEALLIHCVSGISRSGCLALALLMRLDDQLSYDDALALVREGRPEISPNSGFERQLREYEMALRQRKS